MLDGKERRDCDSRGFCSTQNVSTNHAGAHGHELGRGPEISEPTPNSSLRAKRSNPGATSRCPWVASSQELLAMTGGASLVVDTLVVKILDTSLHGKAGSVPPPIDRAVESASRGLVRRGLRALRKQRSAYRSGSPKIDCSPALSTPAHDARTWRW
jgi:hypothetical protein